MPPDLTNRPPQRGRWTRRLLRRGWIWGISALLIALGLANVYPLIWNLGTSFKSRAEVSEDLATPVPRVKYWRTGAEASLTPTGLDQRRRRLLSFLRRRRDGAPPLDCRRTLAKLRRQLRLLDKPGGPVTAEAYRRRFEAAALSPEAARAELAELTRLGLLTPAANAMPAPTAQWRRTVDDLRALRAALARPARQEQILDDLRIEDGRRRENEVTFVHSRVDARQYARRFGLGSLDTASDELDELVSLGQMRRGRLLHENYKVVWQAERFSLRFMTSAVLTVAVVFGTVMVTGTLGYALARMRFPGKPWVLAILLVGAVAPREAVIIPIFRLLQSTGLLGGLWGMILWLTSVGIGNTFLMAGFFLTLPKEVDEAARVDGAGPVRVFLDIALPMARPIVATVALFAFLGAWNNFLIPLLCTMSRPSMQPLSVAVFSFQRGHQGFWELTNAAAAIMIVPVVILFLLIQRHIVRSIAAGAVKG